MTAPSLRQLSQSLAEKKISSLELTQDYLQKIHALDPQLNAFITICEEQALQQAKAADLLRQKNQGGIFTGLPIAHKDIFCTTGVKTSCGSKMLDNFISPYNATVIQKFADAGAVMLGKTNMDEFAMGSSNENSYYGAVKNPWDMTKVPGGSSGGSAAVVAAGLAPAATGTDTGGSIRQPAAFCGITGLKPTYGRVSRYGMVAFASSLDQGGPLARSAEDISMLLQVMSGFDEKDSTSIDHPVPNYTDAINKPLTGLRIGIPQSFLKDHLDPKIATLILQTADIFEKLGAVLSDIELPHCHLSVPVYYTIATAECSSNLARYDGVRFGYRCESPKNLLDLYTRTRSEAFGKEVKRRIMLGTYALSAGYYDAYYLKAQKIRRLIRDDFQNALASVDVILSPTAPTTAFGLGEKISDPISMYLSDIYTIPVNLAGLPAIAFPVGFINNLPVGAQLIANIFQEEVLLNVTHRFQCETDHHQQQAMMENRV